MKQTINPVLAFDWQAMVATASGWTPEEALAWQRVIAARLTEQIEADPDLFAANLSANDAERLPNSVINLLIDRGILLGIGAATTYGGYSGNNSLISAVKYASRPIQHIQMNTQYLFTKAWIDEYKRNSPGRGRPAKGIPTA